jgi:drug/metabolite transporter (DMT)-like permease
MLELRHGDATTVSAITPRAALLMTLPPLLWASNAVIGRLLVGNVPPLTLNFLRWVFAGLILLPLAWRVLREPGVMARRWPQLLALGLLGVGSYNSLQYLALVTSSPINVTLIAASTPVGMLAVGALVHGVRATRREAAGALLSLVGVLLVLARGELASLAQVRFVPGDLYMVAAVIAWSFYSWMLARPPRSMRGDQRPDWNWAEFLFVQALFGLMGAGVSSGAELTLGDAGIEWSGWVIAALLYIAIGPSVIAYRCWGIGVALGGPALAAFFGNLTPVFAALMSVAVLGEAPHWYHAAAFVLIVAGIAVSMKRTPGPAPAVRDAKT